MAIFGIKKIFQTKLTDTSTSDLEGVGTLRFEGNKIYKWVKFNNGAGNVASVAGGFAYYYAVSKNGASLGYENSEVTMDFTDGLIGAGVFQAIIADASYGWIQIRGPATLSIAIDVGAADGNALKISDAVDGAVEVRAAVTEERCAIATDFDANLVALNCPF
jgi:hypothetical protein